MKMIQSNTKLLRGIALISLAFALIMCVMVILNYIQLNRIDPVNTELIDQLVERLNDNPQDQELRKQIRELDLLARKAYFTNTWQVRTGGYLILIALAIFFIMYQLLEIDVRRQVETDPDSPTDVLGIQKNARIGISILGVLLVIAALFFSFVSPHELTRQLSISKPELEQPDEESITGGIPAEAGENGEPKTINSDDEDKTADIAVSDTIPILSDNKSELNITETTEEDKNQQTIQDTISKVKVEKTDQAFASNELKMENAVSFRGFNGNGIVYQAGVPTKWNGPTGENILWKATIPLKSYNSPIVWEGKVFLTGANEQKREIYCYDRENGELIWTHQVTGIPGSPAVPPKTTPDTGLGAPTMTTDGQRVYAIFGTGDLVALDMDGNRIWAKNLGVPENHYGHSSSLIMYREKLIVQYDQKSSARIMAFNGSSGAPLWSTNRDVKISWASPVIIYHGGQFQVVLAADPFVIGYDPRNGKELWRTECIYGEVGPSICFDEGIVYSVNDYAQIAAISLENPAEPLWTDSDILSDIPSPVAAKGLLIMPTSYGLMGCYEAKTGQLLWEHEFDENTFASPIVVGSRVYQLDNKGNMHIYRLSEEGYSAVAFNSLGENTVATPAFAAGRIYIRTDENLYCIGTK